MMRFNYKPLLPLVNCKLEVTENKNGRFYEVGANLYPSITTILGSRSETRSGLDKWRARIGDDAATRITTKARIRGNKVHKLIETYLHGDVLNLSSEMPNITQSFKQIEKILNTNLQTICAIESPMYSTTLRVAGRCDLVGIWNDELTVIDFKTTTREKNEKYIENYFLQATAYSLMVEEMCGVLCNKITILIACDELPEAQIYSSQTYKYYELLRKVINAYHISSPSNSNSYN